MCIGLFRDVAEGIRYICCGSILSLVQIFLSFVFGYGNV